MKGAARISVGQTLAELTEDGWESADPALAARLNAGMADDLAGISGADPEPHATLARLGAQRVGGVVDEVTEDPPSDGETVH